MRCSNFAAVRAGRPFAGLPFRILPVAKVLGIGLLVSACASSHASYDYPSNVGMRPPPQVAIAAPPKVELEDDGLAVQAPPRIRKYAEPDDPTEPFSPNYGPAPRPSEPTTVPAGPMHRAKSEPVKLRSRAKAMSPAEAQAIIARAMVEHELRYP